MNRRIDDPRFEGAGVIVALFCAFCFVAGLAAGFVAGVNV